MDTPIIDIRTNQISMIAVGYVACAALFVLLIVATAATSVLIQLVCAAMCTLVLASLVFMPSQHWRLRFFADYWLVDALGDALTPSQAPAYQMTLSTMHTLPFCKQLVLSCDTRKPLRLLIFKDQVDADTWRKLCVFANFKQFGNKFY